MPITVPGVPVEVEFSAVQDMLRGLGIDPKHVISVHISRGGVEVEQYATDSEGRVFSIDNEAARHTIAIPMRPFI